MKSVIATATLCLAALNASAQDKSKPKREEGQQDTLLKEVDKRMKAQGEDLFRAVERLLDERLGKPSEKREAAPKKGRDEGDGGDRASILREVDRRLKAQRDELLKGVEKLLDARLGKAPKDAPRKGDPARKGSEGVGRSPGRLPPGLEMQRHHLPPGRQRNEKGSHARKPGQDKGKRHEDRGKKRGSKGDRDD